MITRKGACNDCGCAQSTGMTTGVQLLEWSGGGKMECQVADSRKGRYVRLVIGRCSGWHGNKLLRIFTAKGAHEAKQKMTAHMG